MRRKAPIVLYAILLLLTIPAKVQARDSCFPEVRNGVYIYEHPDYEGRCSFFSVWEEGSYQSLRVSNLDSSRVGNDTASSIRIVGNYRATLFVHRNLHVERTHTVYAGDDPTFRDDVIGENSTSSILIEWWPGTCRRGDGVFIFEHAGCRGRATQVTGDVADLSDMNIGNNRGSSLSIGGEYAATLYRGPSFEGRSSTFVNSDRDFDDDDVGNDTATSVRIRSSRCNDLAGVYLYEHSSFDGRCSKFGTGGFSNGAVDLTVEYVKNDATSSIMMIGDYIATLYQDSNYRGPRTTFTREDGKISNNPIGNDTASSLFVQARNTICDGEAGVYVYEEANFQGRCSKFTHGVRNLANSYVGEDTASSIRIVGDFRATLYSDRSFGGARSNFSVDSDDLAGRNVGDDQASSIRVTGPYPENESVLRLQVRLVTADVEHADTDDGVVVSLNPSNATWLDYARNDFERGDNDVYDLLLDGVSQIKDIDWLAITKTGSDAWCISEVELIVNYEYANDDTQPVAPQPVYTQSFSPCHWLNNEDGRGMSISYLDLRGTPAWNGYVAPPLDRQLYFTRGEIESRLEGIVGHFLHYDDRAHWGDKSGRSYVEIEKHDDQTIHVDLDLKGDPHLLGVPLPDPEVDLDFNLQLSCSEENNRARVTFDMLDLRSNIDFDWYVEILSLGSVEYIENLVEENIESAFPAVEEDIELDRCPAILIGPDGSIVFIP